MKHTLRTLLVAAILVVGAGAASAHSSTPGVDRREANQRVRIAHGVRSGELTRAEARRLRAGQRHIRRMERRAKADGVVTRGERRRLHRTLNRQSRAIERLEHNGRSI